MTDLVEAFEACIMQETLRWRGSDADVGRVDAFTQAVDRMASAPRARPRRRAFARCSLLPERYLMRRLRVLAAS
jgi:hypothetical protein